MSRDAASQEVHTIDDGAEADKSEVYNTALATNAGAMERLMEEEAVLRHFCLQIQLMSGCAPGRDPSLPTLTKSWRLAATAMVYFRRFYVANNLLSYDPRVLLLACILLAGKVEETNVSMRELLKANPKIQLEDILHAELVLMQGLNFHLKIYHPQSIATTLLVDLRRLHAHDAEHSGKAALDSDAVKDWLAGVDRLLDLLALTEVIMCYNPLDLAVSALLATQPPSLGHKQTLQLFLSQRFGQSMAEDIVRQAPALAAAQSTAQACVDGREVEGVKSAMRRLKQEATWGSVASGAAAKRQRV